MRGGDGVKYMTLTKIYYAMPASYEEMYAVRYQAPFTFHLGIQKFHFLLARISDGFMMILHMRK